LTIVLSSHLIADLERVCDYLVVVSSGRTQVAGEIDQLLTSHRLLTGPRRERADVAGTSIVQESHSDRQSTLLVRAEQPILDPAWDVQEVGLEELVLAYLAQPDATALAAPNLTEIPTEALR